MSENKCSCGREHKSDVKKLIVGKDALSQLPREIGLRGFNKVFLLEDENTHRAAGIRVEELLAENGIAFSKFVYGDICLEPDEKAVGAAVMHFDRDCSAIIAVGSGVIGDIAKLLAALCDKRYMIVATAPSMDGYASATSSMVMDGVKVTLPSKCAEVIIGDTEILKNAPMKMLISGLGDMIAKYISICEWRIAHIIVGEYYCEAVAQMVRDALAECVENAGGLLLRDEKAVEKVFRGLVLAGQAMSYAGASRPASGVEHYFSHVWDMRALECGAASSTHGIQCAIATLMAARAYERIKRMTPDPVAAVKYVEGFDYGRYSLRLKDFLGKSAEAMIALEKKEGKYSKEKHRARLETICLRWNEIVDVIDSEIPDSREIEELLRLIGCPLTPDKIGIDAATLPDTFKATKDIRDKYVLSRLAFDIGVIDEIAETMNE